MNKNITCEGTEVEGSELLSVRMFFTYRVCLL